MTSFSTCAGRVRWRTSAKSINSSGATRAKPVAPANARALNPQPARIFSYWLLLRDPARVNELLTEVQALEGVSHVSSITAQDESEI